MTGSTLGHYRILKLLGKGGMGEVYAADDLLLGRQVAIKVLPMDARARAGDRDRFAQEARVVAALNHPAIVTLYSFEHENDVHFLTMELVSGQPLTQHLPRSGLPVDALLPIALEISEALTAAHEKGVIHRDLKPANVLITSGGQVKVLDFGLAKLRGADAALSGAVSTHEFTGEGRIVGTVAYMSPEQAEGKPVDHRTDIFSFGVILYELATGTRPFQGDTSLSVLSALLKETPRSASDVNPAVPQALARVIKTCLQKDVERRYQSAKDLRNELRTLKEELESGELARAVPGSTRAARGRPSVWWLGAGLAVLALAAAVAYMIWSRPAQDPAAGRFIQLTTTEGREFFPTVSPDGKWFAYASFASGNADIYLQSVGGQATFNLTRDSPADDDEPAFSFDGEQIAFRSEREGGGLFVMKRTGEGQRAIVKGTAVYSPSWSPEGRHIVYATGRATNPASRTGWSALWIVEIASGESRRLLEADGVNPAWSPNGRFIAFGSMASEPGQGMTSRARDLWIVPEAGGTQTRLTNDPAVDWCPQWSDDGRFLYFASDRGGSMNLWRLPMDPETGRQTGAPEAVTAPSPYVANPRMSAGGGHLVYASRDIRRNVYKSAVDIERAEIGAFQRITFDTLAWNHVAPSPDGTRLALTTSGPQEDLYVSAADGSGRNQLTNDPHVDRGPQWSPDGQEIAFYSNRTGRSEIHASDLTGTLRQITYGAGVTGVSAVHWSPRRDLMQFSDLLERKVFLIDPRKPWAEQKPDELPPPPGPGRLLFDNLRWSPDATRLVGSAGGRVLIYDVATRQYEDVRQGQGANWLSNGHLILGDQTDTVIFDLGTRKTRPVTVAGNNPPGQPVSLGGTSDGKTWYFILSQTEEDIWMIKIGRPSGSNPR